MKSPLPALPLSGRAPSSPSRRNNPRTPSDRNTGRAGTGQGGKHVVESISELPLPSSRTGRDTASRGGQRSARAPKSSRSLSSDGGGSDTSDSSSHRASSRGDSASQVSQKLANPFVLMSKQPNLISQFRRTHTSTTVKDGAVVNMDQVRLEFTSLFFLFLPTHSSHFLRAAYCWLLGSEQDLPPDVCSVRCAAHEPRVPALLPGGVPARAIRDPRRGGPDQIIPGAEHPRGARGLQDHRGAVLPPQRGRAAAQNTGPHSGRVLDL